MGFDLWLRSASVQYERCPCNIGSRGRKCIFFIRDNGNIFLQSRSLIDTRKHRFPVSEPNVGGPFKLGGCIGFYSKRFLYLLKAGELREFPLPDGFVAHDDPHTMGELQLPPCRLPFFAPGPEVYIPGTLSSILKKKFFRQGYRKYEFPQSQGKAPTNLYGTAVRR